MKVRILSTTRYNYDKLIENYPFLKDYEIEKIEDYNCQITISSLQDIINLCNKCTKCDNELVVYTDIYKNNELTIEIYDGYRE